MPWLGRPRSPPAPQGRIPGAGRDAAACRLSAAGGGPWEELTRESGPLGAGWADEEARLGSQDGVSTERLVVGGAEGQNRRAGWGGRKGKFAEVWTRPGAKGHLGTPGWRLPHSLNSGDQPRGPHDGYTLCKERLMGNGPS